ncbi:putative permease [wastewater metagenome]|uniref:Putative permease n=2 Tax=unclassified sequences TaxID=12908 RepID=A0A5B8RG47_9ZZZZ|nr:MULTISPECIES: permease [Arhodomonas]MCS4503363.1 permease [Arhodomonas aquaeolei]QEA07601.1 putative permease [uncultured organism]
MASLLEAIGSAAYLAAAMGWEVLWGLVLGFLLSAAVDVLVSKAELQRMLPDDSARSVTRASVVGAASSSCSYAAVAIARSIFRKGGDFTAAMAFQFASTNLVIELGVLLVVLMGWSFGAAEFIGGPIMIALLVLMFRRLLRPSLVDEARRQAKKGLSGSMEGHAGMATMAKEGTWRERLTSAEGWTAISHYFVMNWSMLWKDIGVGLVVSGTLGALVPDAFWHAAFFTDDPVLSTLWGPIIGPLIAVASFTCSIGNVPLAAVLWNGGISFGGVVAFIFGDLIILPILNIYRKYYGLRMAVFLAVVFYVAMVISAIAVELLFGGIGWIPAERNANVGTAAFSLNYTTVLNVIALVVAGGLYLRYRHTGGPEMMRAMEQGGEHDHHHAHGH